MVISQGCHMHCRNVCSQLWQITQGFHKRKKDMCCHITGSHIRPWLSHKLDTVHEHLSEPGGVLSSILIRKQETDRTATVELHFLPATGQPVKLATPLSPSSVTVGCIFVEPAESYSYIRVLDSNLVICLPCILFIFLQFVLQFWTHCSLSTLATKKSD
jgi:hypothetical protein